MNPLPFRNPELPLEVRLDDLLGRLTLDERIEMLHQYQPAIDRLGIAGYKHGTEAAHGIAWLGKATMFPQPIGLAATWDPELLREVGSAIGDEARGFYRRNPEVNGLTVWAPTVDLERDPRWGRTEEAYGEDPFLVGELASALVQGIQGDHPVYLKAAATLKHFLANNHEKDRGTCSATLDPRNLHEYYHQPFERVFRSAGAVSMMTAYNAVNGVPCNLNPDVLTRAKDQWGCAFVVSDAGDVIGTNREHRWFETLAEAVAANLRAGIDSITDDREPCLAAVREALGSGLLTEDDIGKAVRNSLRVRVRLGEFDPEGLNPYEALGEEQIGSPDHEALALRAARQSVVLLKNDQLLPLDRSTRVAVIGALGDWQLRDWYSGEPTSTRTFAQALKDKLGNSQVEVESGSDHLRFSYGGRNVGLAADGVTLAVGAPVAATFESVDWGWDSHTFRDLSSHLFVTTDDRTLQVKATEVFGWFTKEVILAEVGTTAHWATWNARPVTIGAGGTLTVGDAPATEGRIGIDAGTGDQGLAAVRHRCATLEVSRNKDGLAAAARAASLADTAVVVVGNHPLVNAKETIDRTDIGLPASQIALVKRVAEVQPRVVLVVVSSYPLALDEVLPHVSAVVHITHGGPSLGQALADTLVGDHNPSGRLPMTWYSRSTDLPALDDYDVMRTGRTYRWFTGRPQFPFGHGLSYSRVQYLGLLPVSDSNREFEVQIHNSGTRAVEEVVQIYLTLEGSPVPRPRQQLVGFRRVPLQPGEGARVRFTLDPQDFARWDVVRQDWAVDVGTAVLAAGPSSGDLRLTTSFTVEGTKPALRDPTQSVAAAQFDDHLGARFEYCREGGSAVTGRWLSFQRWAAPVSVPRAVEVRIRTRVGTTVEFRWGRPTGIQAARLEVPGGSEWVTVTAPVQSWSATDDLYLMVAPGGREEGVSWFRFLA